MFKTILFASAIFWAGFASAAPAVPDAIWRDPPIDKTHPMGIEYVTFQSHGIAINGSMGRAAGAGVHPTAIFLHGFPGYEANTDLQRTLQRAGWNVVTFHYRGLWGSGGDFSLVGGVEDAEALLAYLQDPAKAASAGIDTSRIVLIGHSYGGYVAAAVMAAHPEVRAAILMAPWDVAEDRREMSALSSKDMEAAIAGWSDDATKAHGVTGASMVAELMDARGKSDLAQFASRIANRPLLVLTATQDDPDDKAKALLPALHQAKASQMTEIVMDTNHSFIDHRIALQKTVLDWLAPITNVEEGKR